MQNIAELFLTWQERFGLLKIIIFLTFWASTPETVCMVVWNDGMNTSGEVEIKAESIMQKLIADNKRFIKLLNYNTLLQTG